MSEETRSLALRTANNAFTSDLYQELFEDKSKGNLVFSPFSLSTVLSMVGLGAQGSTRTQIFNALKFDDESDEAIGSSFKSVLRGFRKSEASSYTLLTANRVYTQTGFRVKPKFLKALKDHFGADLEQLDMSTKSKCKLAVQHVNKWVESTTNKKIKNLLEPDDLDSDTSIILVNGIYFKGLWEHPFSKAATHEKEFRLKGGKRVEVKMMAITRRFPYGQLSELAASAVALPYKGDRLAMIIVLPDRVDGLSKVSNSIGKILKGGRSLVGKRLEMSDKIELELPRFRMEGTVGDLPDVLRALGMKAMFSASKADFGGITDQENLWVDKVIQKAFIQVNEEGTEAAAASAIAGVKRGVPSKAKPIRFIVDRPFYFQIVDQDNGDLVLFSGHCNDPTKTD